MSAPAFKHLRRTQDSLRTLAPICRAALILAGASLFLGRATRLLGTSFDLGERVVLGIEALVYLGGFGLAAVLCHRLLLSAAEFCELMIDHATTQHRQLTLLETDLLPAVERLADALDSGSAVKDRQPPAASSLSLDDLMQQLNVARKQGEADAVLDLRKDLAGKLEKPALDELDRELVAWFTRHMQRELRQGRAAIVAEVLGRAIEVLGHVEEMQPLQAALPMVRRSAGLCAQCGRPHRGQGDVCPACWKERAGGNGKASQ